MPVTQAYRNLINLLSAKAILVSAKDAVLTTFPERTLIVDSDPGAVACSSALSISFLIS